MEYFRNFEQDAKGFAAYARTPPTMPMLSGEKASGQFLIDQGKLVDTSVAGVVSKGAGHWLMEAAPTQAIPKLVDFLTQWRRVSDPAFTPGASPRSGRRPSR